MALHMDEKISLSTTTTSPTTPADLVGEMIDGVVGVDEKSPVSSTATTTVGNDVERSSVPTVPDGGVRAWFQVLGGFLLWFNLWGYAFAFGSFQNYYDNVYLPTTSPSSIAWIGSVQTFLLVCSGVYTGPLFDLGHFKTMIGAGAVLSTFGAFMLGLSTEYWQIFLAQGVCIGLGCGVLFVPIMALAVRAFTKRRALAVGMMSCGAPVGSIIYTFMFEGLLDRLGFAWTTRVMAFFMLGTYALSIPLLMWRVDNTGVIGTGTKRRLIDKAALTDLPFWSYSACVSLQFMAYLVPFFFMPTYAQTKLGASTKVASSVLAIAQAASVPGRILAAIAATYFGVMISWTVCAVASGTLCLAWIAVNDIQSFIAFCALYGAFSGALIPLPPAVFPRLVEDHHVLGTRLGMAQAVSSFTSLVGPPIAGALLRANSTGNDWLAVQLFSGLVLMFAAVQMLGLWRILVTKKKTKFFI